MGGTYGDVRGKSKIETYQNYLEVCRNWPGGGENFDDFSQDPDARHKKVCYSEMVWDPDRKEWVLNYHLHT
jgi:hypothetical protein